MKNYPNIEKAVRDAVKIAEDNTHGYDQQHRYGPDYDCSSLIGAVLNANGFQVSKFSWTGNLHSQLIDCGFAPCKAPWQPGDIHLTPGRHVCMSVDANRIVHARSNELGKAAGGRTGDQTGHEIEVSDYYEPSYGWYYHLRYQNKRDEELWAVAEDVLRGKYGNSPQRNKKLEAAGYDCEDIQDRVNAWCVARKVINGDYGNQPERQKMLEDKGYKYEYVQAVVNLMLNNVVPEG